MSQTESCHVRQVNELAVLKAIFGNELRDLRKNKQKKKWQPLDISVTLTPQQGMSGPAEVYAKIDLHIGCGEKYPEEPPIIKFDNSQGLSNEQIATLISETECLADQLKGEVMIFELAQHVQKFLHAHNKPGFGSFYEEMVTRRREQLQSELEKKQLIEDKERQVLQDEVQKRQEALKAELRDRRGSVRLSKELRTSPKSIPSSPHDRVRNYSRRRCMSVSESSDSGSCDRRSTKVIHFDNNRGERQVHRGKCLGQSAKGSLVYAGVDMTTGELLAVSEWSLKCGKTGEILVGETMDSSHSMKQIGIIEQELNYLHKFHHANIVHYLNMKVLHNEDNIVIYILQDFVVGTTCSFFLSENIPVAADMLRHIASGVLDALRYLHANNIVHRDLRDTSVHIDRMGIIKVSDYSLNKRLSDLYRSSYSPNVEQDFPNIQGRGGKKADIYRFGVLLASLFQGNLVSDENTGWELDMQPELKDFVAKCLNGNERSRWSAEQLSKHCFIRTPLEHGMSPARVDGKKIQIVVEPEEPAADVNFHVVPTLGGRSRIHNDFEILKWLGKGAFGDVLKVRAKLDGGIYAIKRIELNPKSRQLNKKITREVKLLSRLNHENVVRYYTSWIEIAKLDDPARHSSFTPAATPTTRTEDADTTDRSDTDDIEKLAPALREVEWNISYESHASIGKSNDCEKTNIEESSSGSDSDEDWPILMRKRTESSDSVQFEKVDTSRTSDMEKESRDSMEKNGTGKSDLSPTNEIQFMYIQMEFCEKSTLRTAIDNNLYEDEERLWRLFREMVEGLAHIHQQGMIHRDLKPVNIFLDSNDNVKIGDFGLATTNILSSLAHTTDIEKEIPSIDKVTSFDMEYVGSLTGQVGTTLYVAPELSTKAAKAIYNQKVDIYSLGIILFEMCYKPLSTGMERVKILLNLRSKEIILPDDMTEEKMPHQVHLLRWLLDHDPSKRPTSQELLASEYLPPPQREEAELQEMVRHTLSKSESKAYKYLVSCCFGQQVTAAVDITYDMDLPSRRMKNSIWAKRQFILENVRAKVVKVFRRHGGVNLTTPLLMPKSEQLYNHTDSCVKLMTRTGSIVSIPHDLRAPFARYVAGSDFTNLRRYSIDRVYREIKTHGFHPRELYECAFDIISPTANNLMMEAELICITWEIFGEIPELRDRNFTVRLNHTSLLEAVLMYCGIEREKYQDIYSILCDARDGKFSNFQVKTHLMSLCLTDQAMERLSNLFETESSVEKIASVLRTITRRKSDAAVLAKEGLKEIEIIMANAEALGVKWPITVVPLLAHNTQQHSGVMYQITCDSKRRKREGQEVIAAGGRYDNMLMSFRQLLKGTGSGINEARQYGVGISISLDKLVGVVAETTEEFLEVKFGIDVAVCCVDGLPKREDEMADVLRELWTLDSRIITLDLSTTEEVLDYCREYSINHVVTLKCGEKGNIRVQTWERDRYQERKINSNDILDYLQKQMENILPSLNRSESKVNTSNETAVTSNNLPNVDINFVLSERDKISGSGRRSLKNTILAQMSSCLQKISYKVMIEVFAVYLEMTVIRTMVGLLEIDEKEQDFQRSIQLVIDKHPRHKKYIKQICDEMSEVRNEKQRPVIALYSLVDNRHLMIM